MSKFNRVLFTSAAVIALTAAAPALAADNTGTGDMQQCANVAVRNIVPDNTKDTVALPFTLANRIVGTTGCVLGDAVSPDGQASKADGLRDNSVNDAWVAARKHGASRLGAIPAMFAELSHAYDKPAE